MAKNQINIKKQDPIRLIDGIYNDKNISTHL